MDGSSLETGYDALRRGCALGERSPSEYLEVSGADRLRFLHAYVTCDIKGLTAGQGTYGFFTSPQGRILADVVVVALPDRLWLELPAGTLEPIVAHLRKYLLADRVEMRPLAVVVPLVLAGPRAAAALSSSRWALSAGAEGTTGAADAATAVGAESAAGAGGGLPTAPWSHVQATLAAPEGLGATETPGGIEVTIQRRERLGVPAYTLWVPAGDVDAVRNELLAAGGAQPASLEAVETVRVEAGIPRYGLDFGAQNFPQETGAEEAVSYTKGCYLGQEVVARIHYRGGVQKGLQGLFLDLASGAGGDAPIALSFEGREAGTLGSTAFSIALGRSIALAILHRRAAAPGSRLEMAGGGTAEVRPLPFVAAGPAAGESA